MTEQPEPAASDTDIGPLLDAFGQVLSVYGQASFDLPGRPASQVLAELEPWRRHAVLGIPVMGSEHVTQHGAFDQRNFKGAAQVFAELRRVEKQLAESALTDLRECLWTCVNRVHAAVQADHVADSATAAQLKRVGQAIQGIETGAVKDEVMQALSSIEHISRTRRDQQHASFAVLAERIKVLGTELLHSHPSPLVCQKYSCMTQMSYAALAATSSSWCCLARNWNSRNAWRIDWWIMWPRCRRTAWLTQCVLA